MPQNRPHIILIMTDQQRWDTIGAWGCDYMVTPNMDRLAEEGVSFRQAYCPGATCIASRAAIFTGMYPHTTGVYSFNNWGKHRNWVQDLNDTGYFCANIGKMHFSPRDIAGGFHERVIVENPTNKTLDNGGADDDWGRFLTHHGQKRPNDRQRTDPDWLDKYQGVPWHLEERFHSDVFIGDAACAWIRNHQGDTPFFLQVGFTGPHEPWDPLPRHLDLYEGKAMPEQVRREGELDGKPPQHRARQKFQAEVGNEAQIDITGASDEDLARMKRHYYANITTVDEKLGEVLAALEERGWLQESLLIFCSDHGELLGDHDLAYKWLMYDPVVHVPLIVRYPGAAGRVDDLVSLMDLGPTIMEAAGVEIPDYCEGRSLGPYLRGEEMEGREFVFAEDNYLVMMRNKDWKLVYYIGQEEGELYDLGQDPDELFNLWSDPQAAQDKAKLLAELLAWMTRSNYWTSAYKRGERGRHRMRWPGGANFLQGISEGDRPQDGYF
ncbi:MAG: sulfatase-like hydrolase/transferase [Gemmatimonadetes bacterium]|nr:sulfatase-like hydrolase/transferase [Gemmatimonadota bacterium]MBT5328361.1 sulfatase-like hydrolase/transferase [Gemmatimonadota bacterium]MBT5448044.1 sulfatase-like hydrolase/transferase [Gemmatimonadota bacterium]MBT5800658.1 sulfatase-like hydrolase/transferase [Gemmatimonadota bacterium]